MPKLSQSRSPSHGIGSPACPRNLLCLPLPPIYKGKEGSGQERLTLYWCEKVLARFYWLTWRAAVAFLPHSFRHRRDCGHPGKSYLWKAKDGCWGTVCVICHMVEPWSPSFMPDVVQVMRMRFEGSDLWAEEPD